MTLKANHFVVGAYINKEMTIGLLNGMHQPTKDRMSYLLRATHYFQISNVSFHTLDQLLTYLLTYLMLCIVSCPDNW